MAHGLPIVATRVGGVTEIVDESRALLVDAGDEKGLIEATEELISSAKLRGELADEGFAYVKKNHSLDYLQKQLINIYSKLIAK